MSKSRRNAILARLLADNDQDRMACRKWWREASDADKLAVWDAIQEPQDDPVWEIVTRFAQLAFAEMMGEECGVVR